MARHELEHAVTLSVIDRLIDEEPKKQTEELPTRAKSLRKLKDSLKRDLEWLLNTRRNPDLEEGVYREAERSVYGYGLPDITSLGYASTRDQARLRRALESAISTFEPRILGPRVSMEVSPNMARGIRFHIQGLLRVDPAPEPVVFDTVLELPAGHYSVKGE